MYTETLLQNEMDYDKKTIIFLN